VDRLISVDWSKLFVPEHSVLEMIVRGTLMYLALFILLRLMGRRQSGSLGTADLLVIVLIADAAQNGLARTYASVTEGIALVMTILAWDYLIDWARYRFPSWRPLLTPPALPLIRNGRLLRKNMHREFITEEELLSQLRGHGVESPSQVKRAQLEQDGRVSVVKYEG